MKLKSLVYSALIILFIPSLFLLLQHNYNIRNEKSNKEKEVVSNSYDCLIEEGKNTTNKNEVLQYLKNGGEYVVQSILNHEGCSYKSIQINMIEHEHKLQTDEYANDIISIQMLNSDKYKGEILKKLDETTQVLSYEDGCKEYDKFRQSIISEYTSDFSKRIEMTRTNDFELMEKWCVTALIKYSDEGDIVDAIVYEGSIGGELSIEDEKIVWNLCVAEKMLYDYWIMFTQNNEKKIAGHGSISGTVYKLNINSEFNADEIECIRKTSDNDFYQLDADVISNRPLGNVYVKNYELTLDDFKNNKTFKSMVYQKNEYISDDNRKSFRELFGYEHLYTHLYDGVYFTADGYVVLVARPAKYVKMTPEEFSRVDYYNWYSCFTEFLYEDEKHATTR